MPPSLSIVVLLIPAICDAFVAPSLGSRHLPATSPHFRLLTQVWSVVPTEKEKEITNIDDDSELLRTIRIEDLEDSDFLPSVALAESVDSLEEENDQKLGIWAARGILLLVAMLWGTNFASVKYLETLCFHPPCNHLPSEAALARFGVAAMVSIPLLIGKRKDVILAGLECGLWITIGYISQAMALQTISSAKCAFICSLTVVVVPLISALFGKPIKLINIASAVVALTGVGVLEGLIDVSSLVSVLAGASPAFAASQHAAQSAIDSSSLTEAAAAVNDGGGVLGALANTIGVSKGDILALGQPFGFGFSFMRIEHYVEKFDDVENRILTISAAECVMVGFCSLLWVLYDFHGTIPNFEYMLDWHRTIAVLWTGIMTTVVAIYFEGFALQVASASEAALTFASEPVWASLFGSWLLREQLGVTSYIGGFIILSACVLGTLGDMAGDVSKEETPPEKAF